MKRRPRRRHPSRKLNQNWRFEENCTRLLNLLFRYLSQISCRREQFQTNCVTRDIWEMRCISENKESVHIYLFSDTLSINHVSERETYIANRVVSINTSGIWRMKIRMCKESDNKSSLWYKAQFRWHYRTKV